MSIQGGAHVKTSFLRKSDSFLADFFPRAYQKKEKVLCYGIRFAKGEYAKYIYVLA